MGSWSHSDCFWHNLIILWRKILPLHCCNCCWWSSLLSHSSISLCSWTFRCLRYQIFIYSRVNRTCSSYYYSCSSNSNLCRMVCQESKKNWWNYISNCWWILRWIYVLQFGFRSMVEQYCLPPYHFNSFSCSSRLCCLDL